MIHDPMTDPPEFRTFKTRAQHEYEAIKRTFPREHSPGDLLTFVIVDEWGGG